MRAPAGGASCPIPSASAWRCELAPLGAPVGRASAPLRARRNSPRCSSWRPPCCRRRRSFEGPGTAATEDERRARVILLAGCAQQVLRPEHQRRHHPPARPPRRRRRGGAGRGLLRRARPSHGRRGERRIAFAKRNVDAWSQGDGEGAGRRHHHQRVGLRHDGQGLRPHAAARARLCRAGRHASPALARDITEFLGTLRAGRRPSAGRRCASPITRPARCSTASASSSEPRELLRKAGFTRRRHPRGRIICCGSAGTYNILQPEIAGELRDRKVDEHQARAARRRRHRQHRLHHADRRRHRHPDRPHRRAARLGLRRPRAARPRERWRAMSRTCPSPSRSSP